MSFPWIEYLHLAENLAETGTHSVSRDAKKRAAISRAYYAAYCLARDKQWGADAEPPDGGESHTVLIRELIQSGGVKGQVGNDLQRLKTQRKRADYMGYFSDLDQQTSFVLRVATRVVQKLEGI